MGPAKQSSSAVKAAALRQELIRRCKDEGFAANAEHKDIRQQFEPLGTDVALCTLELQYARLVDVIVFVPAMPIWSISAWELCVRGVRKNGKPTVGQSGCPAHEKKVRTGLL